VCQSIRALPKKPPSAAGNFPIRLINDILDMSKIESGTVVVDAGELRLNDLQGYTERTFRHVAESKNLGFLTRFDPRLPKSIYTDSKRLQQIIKNLLSNAFKFTHQGQVTLTVEPAAGGWSSDNEDLNRAPEVLAFSVADTGIGIAADKQQIIFEAFQQADGSTSREYGGTGLGLAISRELSRLLGGEIRLVSTPSRGSTFILYLPTVYTVRSARKQLTGSAAVQEVVANTADCIVLHHSQMERFAESVLAANRSRDGVQMPVPVIVSQNGAGPGASIGFNGGLGEVCLVRPADSLDTIIDLAAFHLHFPLAKLPEAQRERLLSETDLGQSLAGRRVLIVDDDMRNIFALSTILEEHDAEIVSADNGRDAIRILQEDPKIEIVLIDIMMPEMDGMETMRAIRKIPQLKNLPIVAVTAKAMKGDREKCIEAGAWDYLSKPVDADQLLGVLRSWLNR
jgi:CheY-like chemotaxis protein